MAARSLRVLENGRHVTRGLFEDDRSGAFVGIQAEGEVETYRVDLSSWVASGETILSSALAETSGATITKTNGTDYVDLTVSGITSWGETKLSITTSAGRVKVVKLAWCVPENVAPCDAYDQCC